MRIGIDGHVLGKNIGGVERYVEKVVELVPDRCPQHEFIVFVTKSALSRFASDRRWNVKFVGLTVADPLLQRSLVLPWAIRRHRLDALQVQRIAPWACGNCRIALTVHDIIPIKYAKGYKGFRNDLIRLLTPGSLRRAHMILTPSQSVCDDIARHYPNLRAPLRPFSLGTDPARFAPRNATIARETADRYGITRPFIFSPGAVEVRKNIAVVIRALALIPEAERPHLLLSGSIRDRDCFARLQALAAECGVAGFVRHLGFLPEDDLITLYGQATLCIAASHDEGFNLLPLEAMTCGTRVLCSDIPVHRELFHGGAVFFDPNDAEGLSALLRDGMQANVEPGVASAGAQACLERHSWDAMAGQMALLFDEIAKFHNTTSKVAAA